MPGRVGFDGVGLIWQPANGRELPLICALLKPNDPIPGR